MSGVTNGDGTMPDEFMPGIRWAGQLAPGSTASRTPAVGVPPTGETGTPGGSGTTRDVAGFAGETGRSTAAEEPGQNDLGVLGADKDPGYVQTGAGHGEAVVDNSFRYDWQQRPGGA
jgi:hypothetical protein